MALNVTMFALSRGVTIDYLKKFNANWVSHSTFLYGLLQRFWCFLLDYAGSKAILEAFEDINNNNLPQIQQMLPY